MGLDLKALVDENLQKGSNRVLVTVILFALVALAGQNLILNKSADKFTKELYTDCKIELTNCQFDRNKQAAEFLSKLEKYNEAIQQARREIKTKSKMIDIKLNTK